MPPVSELIILLLRNSFDIFSLLFRMIAKSLHVINTISLRVPLVELFLAVALKKVKSLTKGLDCRRKLQLKSTFW
jgi:prepilin signal peptidase PulO-like enzyme (type II secretory pathway)